MRMLTKGKKNYLRWQKDSYLRNKIFVRTMPTVLKLMLIKALANKSYGLLEIISGIHAFDINNNVLDKIITCVFLKKKKTFITSKREYILFDDRIFHRRISYAKNRFSSAAIINLKS